MDVKFTDRQLDMMNILWDRGSATVREAKEELDEDLAYTSVLTVFQTLEEDGHVNHEQEGRAYRYYPTVTRWEAGREAVDYILHRLFDRSPAKLLEALADQDSVHDEMSEQLREVSAESLG